MKGRYRIESEVDMGSPKGMFTGGARYRWGRSFVPRAAQEPGGIFCLMRKAAGKPPLEMPREAAGYRVMHDGSWEWVTWKEIHGNRAKAQRERLERLRRPEEVWPRRAQLWVFFNDGFIYGGWHVYVRYWSMVSHREEWAGGGYKGGWGERGIDSLMEKIPLDLASAEGWLFPPEGWVLRREWCEAFAAAYPKRPAGEDTRKAGLLNGWTDGHDFFLTREEAMGKEAAA